jgi:hypothetical protein
LLIRKIPAMDEQFPLLPFGAIQVRITEDGGVGNGINRPIDQLIIGSVNGLCHLADLNMCRDMSPHGMLPGGGEGPQEQ